MYFISIFISFFAALIGCICGLGGGLLIKPILEIFQYYSIQTIHILSGFCVFSMALSTILLQTFQKKKIQYNLRLALLLSVSSAIGGFIGKQFFFQLQAKLSDSTSAILQAILLIIMCIFAFLCTAIKQKLKPKNFKNPLFISSLGLILGSISSFLGIGGGPINVLAIYYFFQVSTKEASFYSIYIIFFSQFISLITTFAKNQFPNISISMLISMMLCGCLGALIGKKLNQFLKEKHVNILFQVVMLLIILLNLYNISQYIRM